MPRPRPVRSALLAAGPALLVLLGAAAANEAVSQSVVSVSVDNAKVIRLPEKTATVIVGNPMIADITLQRNGVVVLTGKSFGSTNLIALDGKGTMLAESTISVQAPQASLRRGGEVDLRPGPEAGVAGGCERRPSVQLPDGAPLLVDLLHGDDEQAVDGGARHGEVDDLDHVSRPRRPRTRGSGGAHRRSRSWRGRHLGRRPPPALAGRRR